MNGKREEKQFTNFGFQKVNIEEKKKLVGEVFSSVASRYDLMNDLMSFGVHRLWKKQFCAHVHNFDSAILDVAGGSGDITFKLKEKALKLGKQPSIIICDINQEMLKIAKNKAIDKNLFNNIDYVCADAEKLPFPDNSFDYYTIAFGIRNISRIDIALKEAYRVLKSTGKLLCLEFSKIENNCLQNLYNLYSFNIIPRVGKIVSGNESAYQYLVESIDQFPDQEEFKIMIKDAGFQQVSYQNLTFGIAAIHSAYKI